VLFFFCFSDSYFWQAVCLSFGVFLGLACIDDYEVSVFSSPGLQLKFELILTYTKAAAPS
jgi:hypothetical protein